MFEIAFIVSISLFVLTSALSIISLHTDDPLYFRRARIFFFLSLAVFLLLGSARFYHVSGDGWLKGAFTLWGYFYLLALLLLLVLVYLLVSRWREQWRSFSALSLPFITFILMLSIPFVQSSRRISVELSHGLLPVHIVITILGELLLFFSFAGSVLYLVMEWQLRKKSSMKFIYRLPTLESIEKFNRWAVSRSFVLLSVGLVTGMFLAFAAFSSPWLGSPKEIILYCAWLVLFMLFYLRHSRRISTHRVSQVNAAVFVLLMFVFIFSNIYITKGFHGFK